MQLGFDDVQASFCRGVNEVKKKKRNFVINDSNLIIIENSAEAAPYMMEP